MGIKKFNNRNVNVEKLRDIFTNNDKKPDIFVHKIQNLKNTHTNYLHIVSTFLTFFLLILLIFNNGKFIRL